jgi:hypothetical protein
MGLFTNTCSSYSSEFRFDDDVGWMGGVGVFPNLTVPNLTLTTGHPIVSRCLASTDENGKESLSPGSDLQSSQQGFLHGPP